MNSCAAICELVAPSAASRAICASCAVRMSGVSAAHLGACPPHARSSTRARSANAPAPLEAQPLAIQQMSAPELHGQASAAKAADGLPVKGLSILTFAHKRSRAGFDAQRPVAPAGA